MPVMKMKQDLLQEGFLKIFQSWEHTIHRGSLEGWIKDFYKYALTFGKNKYRNTNIDVEEFETEFLRRK